MITTISTKQLRENMPEVIRALREGESVRLTYRRKHIGTIEPQGKSKPLRRGSPEAVRRGLAALKDVWVPEGVRNDPRSIKEQVADLRSRKYGR